MKKANKKVLNLIIILTVTQSILYYLAKLIQGSPTIIGSEIDNYIPFISYFVYFYVIWYVMLILVPYIFYEYNRKDFNKYVILYILCGLTANIIFLLFPTTINRANIIPTNFTLQIIDIVYFFDIPVLNCFPSMHCIISFLFIIIANNCKELPKIKKYSIIILSILVILSTLLIKQHVLYDVIGALIIVIIYDFIYEKFIKKKNIIEKILP